MIIAQFVMRVRGSALGGPQGMQSTWARLGVYVGTSASRDGPSLIVGPELLDVGGTPPEIDTLPINQEGTQPRSPPSLATY
jgi:hypothetical protein